TLAAMGLTILKTPVRSPQANAFCERVIGTIRRECLDWMILLNESHLRRALSQWVAHYNRGRPHEPRPGHPGCSRPRADAVRPSVWRRHRCRRTAISRWSSSGISARATSSVTMLKNGRRHFLRTTAYFAEGLVTAFLVAGASSVLATLWPLSDGPAAIFQAAYYDHLLNGLAPPFALAATQRAAIRGDLGEDLRQPANHGAYVLHGVAANPL